MRNFLTRYSNELGLVVAIVGVIALTGVLDEAYRAKPIQNAQEIVKQTSLLGIFALGAALVIISGGIDLSSGSVIAFSGVVFASIVLWLAPTDEAGHAVTAELPKWIFGAAFVLTLFVGFLIGTLHAWLITSVGLPPFVATLASLVGLRSFARIYVPEISERFTGNATKQLYIYDETFRQMGADWWVPLVFFLIVVAAMWLLMDRTVVGRHIYAMGGNEQAARLSGIRTERLKWLAYVIGAMTASLAGILYCAEVTTADPEKIGRAYELNAIAAAVVGGCSLMGGIGTVPGVILGALFLRVVIDAVPKVIKQGAADDWQGLVIGVLVVLAVAFNELRRGAGVGTKFFTGALGAWTIAILGVFFGSLVGVSSNMTAGLVTGVLTVFVLGGMKLFQRRRTGGI